MPAKLSLRSAPLVVARQKTKPISIMGGRQKITVGGGKDELTLDVTNQSLSDVRYLLREIIIQETDEQIRAGNDPSRVIIDNREGKPLHSIRRKGEVQFGVVLDQLMIKAISKAVRTSVRAAIVRVLKHTPEGALTGTVNWAGDPDALAGIRSLVSGGAWEWRYAADPRSPARKVNPYQIGALAPGALLIYYPKSQYFSLANMLSARIDAGWRDSKLLQRGRSGGRGMLYKGVEKIRRNRNLKNYDIKIAFTRKFVMPNEIYHPGTGDAKQPRSTACVVVRAVRRTRSYGRRRR